MLGLVDYAGSDEDDIGEAQSEECIRKKHRRSTNTDNSTTNGFKQEDDVVIEDYDDIINAKEGSSIRTNLPPAIPLADKPVQQEKELDDLVKRKKWELKLAKKAKRKRKRHRTHHTNSSSENHHSSKNLVNNQKNAKKMVVIQAFSGLKGLISDGKQGESDEEPNYSLAASSSSNLLAILPEPKNASRVSRNLNLFMSSNKRSTGNAKIPEVARAVAEISKETKSAEEEYDDASDEDHDSIDFFGLKTVGDPPVVSNITTVSDISRDKKLEEVELTDDMKVENNISAFISHPEITADTSPSTTVSGVINDSQALCMIYSRDVAHLGGTVSNAAKAVENIIDVNVDKVLGPNVHATLLKNLHNKSLAEATLSHLANVPKSKDTVNTVARRKHQITYLASVAVAREEQLAEQWSVNRHNKRSSARKYGF
ncbi:Mitotic checkpoint regulator MAD2B-interacting family protein [Acanthocheilonema viteae]